MKGVDVIMGILSSIKRKLADVVIKHLNESEDSGEYETEINGLKIPKGISLFLGTSTGYLRSRGHRNGMAGGYDVWLKSTDDSIYTNTLILGGTGSGKTSALIRPIMVQIGRYQDCGMFVLDVKGDVYEDVEKIGKRYNRRVVKLGLADDCLKVNILSHLNPQLASSFLQNTFFLCGGGGGGDSFWVDSATAVIEHSLGVLKFAGKQYYNLHSLYQYIFLEDFRKEINTAIVEYVDTHNVDKKSIEYRQLSADLSYFNNVFEVQDIKLQSSIKATISTIISGFCNPLFIDRFSATTDDVYDMTNLLNGDICVLTVPIAEYGNVAKVIYTILKLKYFNLLQQRQYDKSLPQLPTALVGDEYQTIISASANGLSDLDFWSKNRSSKCFGIIATQSITAFEASLKGNRALTNAILANFRNRIMLRNEDEQTCAMAKGILGKTLVQRTSTNYSEGSSGQFFGFTNKNYSSNSSVSYSQAEQDIIDSNIIRQLDGEHALAMLNIDRQSADDIIQVYPMFDI